MIARLALAEGGIDYESVPVDIHARMSQLHPDYVRLNPNMTVPTLALADRVLDQSRKIAEYAMGCGRTPQEGQTEEWLDRHYAYPIEELTFGGILARNPLARLLIPKRLRSIRRRLLASASEHPDLAPVYMARAEVFAERVRIFDPDAVMRLARKRRDEAIAMLDAMQDALADGRAVMVPPAYGLVDVVLTVFLARMQFVGLGADILQRPALARYWNAMRERPSFRAADIWTAFHKLRFVASIAGW